MRTAGISSRMWLTSHDQYLRAGDAYVGVTARRTPSRRCKSLTRDGTRACPGRIAARRTTVHRHSVEFHRGHRWRPGLGHPQPGRGRAEEPRPGQPAARPARRIRSMPPATRSPAAILSAMSTRSTRWRVSTTVSSSAPPRADRSQLDKCSAAIPVAIHAISRGRAAAGDPGPDADRFLYGRRLFPESRRGFLGGQLPAFEVAGSAHAYSYTASFQPSPEDLLRAGFTYSYYNCTSPGLARISRSTTFSTPYRRTSTNGPARARRRLAPRASRWTAPETPWRTGTATLLAGFVRPGWTCRSPRTMRAARRRPVPCRATACRSHLSSWPVSIRITGIRPCVHRADPSPRTRGMATPLDGDAAVNTASNSSIPR